MVQRHLTLTLPNDLADEAEKQGLLTPQSIESILRQEVRRRQLQQKFAAIDQLRRSAGPPMTDAEIEAEITAVRQAQRNSDERRR